MAMRVSLCLFLFLAVLFSSGASVLPKAHALDADPTPPQTHAPASAYATIEVLGWTLRVHDDLVADEELYDQVLGEIHHQLFRLTRIIPDPALAKLREVVVWVELNNSGTAQYHPSRGWLENNGYLPEKARCIEIGDARDFLRYTKHNQPYVLLHELAHAYHHQQFGFDYAPVVDAYNAAMEAGLYEAVLFIDGRTVQHYARTNHKEYFAEATEALLGRNDFYPFVEGEFKEYDPVAYALLVEMWGITR